MLNKSLLSPRNRGRKEIAEFIQNQYNALSFTESVNYNEETGCRRLALDRCVPRARAVQRRQLRLACVRTICRETGDG